MKMNVKKFANKKIVTCVALIAAATTTAMAQGNGLAGINEATSMVTSYFEPGTKLIYAIGAVVGLIGGVKVYGKFSSGDPDTSRSRHLEDRCLMVRCLYLPHRGRYHPSLVLPLSLYIVIR